MSFDWPANPGAKQAPPMLDDDGEGAEFTAPSRPYYSGEYSRYYRKRKAHERYAYLIPIGMYVILAIGLGGLMWHYEGLTAAIVLFVGVSLIFLAALAGMRFIGRQL